MHRNKIPQVFTLVPDCYVAPPPLSYGRESGGEGGLNKKGLTFKSETLFVGLTIELSNKFIVDFEKIIDFILVVLK